MRSILSSTSNSAQGGGRAQPDAAQCCLAGQLEPVKGALRALRLPLTARGASTQAESGDNASLSLISQQAGACRGSTCSVLLRHVPLTIGFKGRIVRVRPDGVQRLGARYVGLKANLWNLERKLSRIGCGHYPLNVPKAPKNESLLVRGAFIATRI